MSWNRILALTFAASALAGAQAPQFRVLDNPLPIEAFADAIEDLDGDGDVDLLNKLGVWVNDGHGRFSGPFPNLLSFPRKVTVLAKLNGDNLVDCISIDGFNNIRIDFNQGGLAFTGPSFGPSLPPGAVPRSLSQADVDLDGDADVLIGIEASPASASVPVLWLNDGSGAFTQATGANLPAGLFAPTFVPDLDGNGYPDAVFVGTNVAPNLRVGYNTAGVFTFPAAAQWSVGLSSFLASDFNGDGFVDLAIAGYGLSVIFNSPSGFGPLSPAGGALVQGMQAIDVDGDGADELLVQFALLGTFLHPIGANGLPGPSIQSWQGLGFQGLPGFSAPRGPESVRDLDGDGDRDLLVVSGRTPIELMNTGAGALVPVGSHSAEVSSWFPKVCDLDADGIPDVLGIAVAGTEAFVTGINDGDGFFHPGDVSPPFNFTPYPSFYSLYPFDRDGDGDSDLFAAANFLTASSPGNPASDRTFDNVSGVFQANQAFTSPGSAVAFAAFDFDADGDQDVLLGRRNYIGTNGIASPMSYLQNDGLNGLAAALAVGGSHSTYDLDLGDFDGNGSTDVFQTNRQYSGPADPCVVYLNPGNAAFAPVVQSFTGWYTAAGDLNGDGMTDLVVDGSVWFAAGAGAFSQGPALTSPLGAPAVLADVDLDGDLDLVETPATVMLNQGAASFGPPISILPRQSYVPWTWEIPRSAVLDLDRDGDPDILAPGPTVISNVARQIAHGSFARLGRPASIDLYGTPGGSWLLFASAGTASFSFPPYGHALIDPASAVLFASGSFGPASGASSLSATVPNAPSLVGWTSYWQAVDLIAANATNRITITVQSY